jgi:hypothetical protein
MATPVLFATLLSGQRRMVERNSVSLSLKLDQYVSPLSAGHLKNYLTLTVTQRGLGLRTHSLLTSNGIPCTVILDSAVAFSMEKTDTVLVGAEGVAENGGLINFVTVLIYISTRVAKKLITGFRLVDTKWQ